MDKADMALMLGPHSTMRQWIQNLAKEGMTADRISETTQIPMEDVWRIVLGERPWAEVVESKDARRRAAYFARRQGMSYRQIGSLLGVTGERARQIVFAAQREIRDQALPDTPAAFYRYERFGERLGTVRRVC